MRHSTVRFKIELVALGLMLGAIALMVSSPVSADPAVKRPIVARPSSICAWDGSSGNWSESAHWLGCGAPGGVPGSNDIAIISGGTVTITHEVTVQGLTFSAGTLQGSNGITVTQAMTWTGGTQSGSGATTIAAGATLNVNGSHVTQNQRTLNNAGTVNWTATIYWDMNNGAILNNLAGATFNAQTNGGILGPGGVFNNQGTFVCSGSGVSSVTAPFNNSNLVQVQGGTLNLNGGGNSSGVFTVSNGAVLNFGGGTHTITLGPADSISGAGTVAFSSGATTITGTGTYNITGSTDVTGGIVNLNLPAATTKANQNNGTLGGSGTLTVTQVMTWTGGTQSGSGATTIAAGATLNVNGSHVTQDQRTLNNAGTVNWTATIYWHLYNGAILNNLAGATFNAQTMAGILESSGAFNNQGTFICSGPGVNSVTVAFYNTGAINVQSGVLQFGNEFVQGTGATRLNGGNLAKSGSLVFNGGILSGTGIITGNVSNVGGAVSPGASPGSLHITGNYTQGPTGTLNIELGGVISGTQHDLLDVSGAASLSGTLNVSLINSFIPISGTIFRIVNFNNRSGDFITKTGMNLGNGLFLLPHYSTDHLSLIVGATIADLGLSVTDGQAYAIAGDPITYTIVVTNAGPDTATGAVVTDTLPGTIGTVTWTCVASGGSCSTPSGNGNLSTTVNLDPGGVITFTLGGRLAPGANGTLINAAYAAYPTDPDLGNNIALDSDIVLSIKLYLPLIIK